MSAREPGLVVAGYGRYGRRLVSSSMVASDLPSPPSAHALEAWAGVGRVLCAAVDMAPWRLPEQQKAALVSCGVPLLNGIVDVVSFRAEPTMYRLAGYSLDRQQPGWTYVAVPETGRVLELETSGGSARFVNSSINHWLCSLHLVGTWLAGSTAIQHWDEDETMEELALAELADLLEQIARLDPAAYGDVGDHRTHFWPAVLDRWLC
ncbi:SUKH-4 family immunity protein [Streptosporangium sp. G12]